MQADIRPFALDRQPVADFTQKADTIERNGNVDRLGELLANRTGRECRGRELIGWIRLDHDDPARKPGMGGKVPGDG